MKVTIREQMSQGNIQYLISIQLAAMNIRIFRKTAASWISNMEDPKLSVCTRILERDRGYTMLSLLLPITSISVIFKFSDHSPTFSPYDRCVHFNLNFHSRLALNIAPNTFLIYFKASSSFITIYRETWKFWRSRIFQWNKRLLFDLNFLKYFTSKFNVYWKMANRETRELFVKMEEARLPNNLRARNDEQRSIHKLIRTVFFITKNL